MAHSTQVCRGRGEVLKDLDLMVLFMFLRDAFRDVGHGAIAHLLAEWERSLRHYGPGLIYVDLDLVVADKSSTQKFSAALSDVRERLGTFGERIPSSILNAQNITPGVVFSDYPVGLLVHATKRLENLVAA
jgi:hypothetical protein